VFPNRRLLPIHLVTAMVVIGVLLIFRPRQHPAPVAARSVFQSVCATCHGPHGEGNRDLMAPPIANLTAWYVDEQLAKFRSGFRGADPRDTHGQQMRAAVLPLGDDAIAEAAAELATLPFVPPEPPVPLPGDLTVGRESYTDLCMECHRYNGHGESAFKCAPLAGLPAWYLEAQLAKFQNGIRGYDPHDESGAKMREMSRRAANDNDRADIISFLTTLGARFPIEKQDGEKQVEE
jgi:cytochrome c553